MKLTVEDVRNDRQIGRGSCSIWDECYTDAELEKVIDEYTHGDGLLQGLRTRTAVLRELRRVNRVSLERMREREEGW
jgi:hypothetical protein